MHYAAVFPHTLYPAANDHKRWLKQSWRMAEAAMTGETSDGPSLSRRVPCGDSGVGPVAAIMYV